MTDAPFSCSCGTLKGVLHDAAPQHVCHLVCYCRDCRAFARHMGCADQLEPGGGSALVQVLPARIDITQGADSIACLRLSPKGLHRWYASCCNTPLANTVSTPRVPMAGMWRGLFDQTDVFGPVRTLGFTKHALKERGAPRRDKGLFAMLSGLIGRAVPAWISGDARRTPFFDEAGAPVTAPVVLDLKQRNTLYKN
ncbi:DUF6151 family protein [uncultured Roseobacter sp.]|uniref:DUF6151 family protein n=1 Tax=uncultured Roseobacter sp. TaxID=114847 RepID=UPI0026156F03|nr:DUF6151 family protein [uncultured Roseobacter sp.]